MAKETWESFAGAAVEDAFTRTGRPGIAPQAVAMSMLRMLHERVVALEVAAGIVHDHPPADAPGREDPAAE